MERFLAKHRDATTGTLSCFARLITGHLPLGDPRAMEEFLDRHGVLFKQLNPFVLRQAERLKVHARAVAAHAGRPWESLEGPVRKDPHARAIAARDGGTEGRVWRVCGFGTIEPCRSFRLASQHGRPAIRPARRKCLCRYVYFVDREFGVLHVRLQTWFPFTIPVYGNGHEWLARQLDRRGLRDRRLQRLPVARGSRPRPTPRGSLRHPDVAGAPRHARAPGQSAPRGFARELSRRLGHQPGRVRHRRLLQDPARASRPLPPAAPARHAVPERRRCPDVSRPQAPRPLRG
jgi:hypothetical protein